MSASEAGVNLAEKDFDDTQPEIVEGMQAEEPQRTVSASEAGVQRAEKDASEEERAPDEECKEKAKGDDATETAGLMTS